MLYRQTFPRLRNRGRTYRNAPVTRSRMKQRIIFRLKKKKEGEGKKKKYLTNNFHYSHFIINFYVHHARPVESKYTVNLFYRDVVYKCSSKKNEKKEKRKIEPIDWIRIWIQSFVCPLIEFNQLNYPGHQPFLFFSPNLKIWNGKRWYVYEIETEIKNEKRFDSSIFIIESYFFIIIIIIIILFSVDQIKFFPTCRNIYDFEVRKRRYIYVLFIERK